MDKESADLVRRWILDNINGEGHSAQETYGPNFGASQDALLAWENYLYFVRRYRPRWFLYPSMVRSDKHGFVEMLDFGAQMDGMGRVIGLIATEPSIPPELTLGLAAAANADYVVTPDGTEPMPQYDAVVILHAKPGSCTLLRCGYIDQLFRQYLDGATFPMRDEPDGKASRYIP